MKMHKVNKLNAVIIEFDNEEEFNRYAADFEIVCSREDVFIHVGYEDNYVNIKYNGDTYGRWKSDGYNVAVVLGNLSDGTTMVAFGRRQPLLIYYPDLGVGVMTPYVVDVTKDDVMLVKNRVERLKSVIDNMYTKARNEQEASRLALLGSNFMAMIDILDYILGQSDILDELEREVSEMNKGR